MDLDPWRSGGSQASLSRLLAMCKIEALIALHCRNTYRCSGLCLIGPPNEWSRCSEPRVTRVTQQRSLRAWRVSASAQYTRLPGAGPSDHWCCCYREGPLAGRGDYSSVAGYGRGGG